MAMDYPVIDPVATGKRIRQLRKARKIRVIDVSEYMGFTEPQAVYKWERGETLPSLDNFYALCRFFDTQMEDIICEREGTARVSSFFTL